MILQLRNIFNASLAFGYFKMKFITAGIRLIPKQGKFPIQVSNYRPISLLETPGKVLEKIFNHRLRTHLEFEEKYNPDSMDLENIEEPIQP